VQLRFGHVDRVLARMPDIEVTASPPRDEADLFL